MHTHASMPVYNKLHCERTLSFIASVRRFIASVLEHICNFGASTPEVSNMLEQARSETLLSQRSFQYAHTKAWRMFVVKLCSRLRRCFECSRSEALRVLEGSPALEAKLRPIRVGRSFDTLADFLLSPP